MKSTKFSFFILLMATFCMSCVPMVRCFDDFDDFDDMDFDLDSFEFKMPPIDPNVMLVATLQALIQKPLWERTNLPNGRDPLYLMPNKISTLERNGIVFNIFFNATNKMPVTFDALFSADCINMALEGVVELLASSSNAKEVTAITPLLRNITLQERKLGGLLQIGFTGGPFIFEVHTPVLLSERNFWLSRAEQEHIRHIIARNFPDGDAAFCTDDLVRYRFGLGDTRLKVGLNLINALNFQFDMGVEGIFPTSKLATSGRIEGGMSTEPEKFLPMLLKRIQQTILKPCLGNGGHFGLGIFVETKLDLFNDRVYLWNRLSFDRLFAESQDRLILHKQTILPSELTVDNLNEFLQQYLFPPVFRVRVLPGSIINFISAIQTYLGNLNLCFGYDFYYQRAERFLNIKNCNVTQDLLLEDKAMARNAEQHKLFTEITYTKKKKKFDFMVGLGGDVTVGNRGIGRDWTIFGKVGILF